MSAQPSKADDATVVAALREAPEVRSFIEAREKKTAAERLEAERELADVAQRSGAEFISCTEKIEKAIKARDAARAVLAAAQAAIDAAVQERMASSYAWSKRQHELEQFLIETCSSQIDTFIASMQVELDIAQKTPPVLEAEVEKNLNTGRRSTGFRAVGATPAQRVAAIRDAIAAANLLKLWADQADVETKLAALRDGLPEIGK